MYIFGSDSPAIKRESQFDGTDAPGDARRDRHGLTPPTLADVVEQLRHLLTPGLAYEVRAFEVDGVPTYCRRYKNGDPDTWHAPTYSGLFAGNDLTGIARAVLDLSDRCGGVYFVPNSIGTVESGTTDNGLPFQKIKPYLPGGGSTAYLLPRTGLGMHRASRATDDTAIAMRELLPFDYDPEKHPDHKDDPATDEERAVVWARFQREVAAREAAGWPTPTIVDSGNGYHVWYHLHPFPAAAGDDLIRRVMVAGGGDTSCVLPSHIMRLPGGLNCKGKASADRPHRRARVIQFGSSDRLTREQLEKYAAHIPSTAKATPAPTGRTKSGDYVTVSTGSTTLTPEVQAAAARICREADAAAFGVGANGSKFLVKVIREVMSGLDLSPADTLYIIASEYLPRCGGKRIAHYEIERAVYNVARRPSMRAPGYRLPRKLRRQLREARRDTRDRDEVVRRLSAVPPDSPKVDILAGLGDSPIWKEGERPPPHKDGPCSCCTPREFFPTKPKESKDGNTSSTVNKVVEETVPEPILDKLIGEANGDFCPYACRAGLEGYDSKTSYSAVALLRCRCWSKCAACREYDRYAIKRDNLPLAANLATHVFTGTVAEWNNVRARLTKLKVKYASFAVSDGDTRTTVIAADPESAPIPQTLTELRPTSRTEATFALAAAIDALPDLLAKGVRKFSPSHTWKLLLEHKTWKKVRPVIVEEKDAADELKGMSSDERDQRAAADKAAEDQAILDAGGIVWTRLDEMPLRTPEEVADILDQHGVTEWRRRSLQGDNVLDSIVWEIPVEPETIEAIRRAIYDVTIQYPPLDELSRLAGELATPSSMLPTQAVIPAGDPVWDLSSL